MSGRDSRTSLHVTGVSKVFERRRIFQGVNIEAAPGDIIALTGVNGSGKTTLLKIIGKLLTPNTGSVLYHSDSSEISDEALQSEIGFVAPYLELYAELTASEHIDFVASLRKIRGVETQKLLASVGLNPSRDKTLLVGAFSSGMKQRLRFAIALAIEPSVLLLDEPTSNLDLEGIEFVTQTLMAHQARGGITVIASNEAREIDLATKVFEIPRTQPPLRRAA